MSLDHGGRGNHAEINSSVQLGKKWRRCLTFIAAAARVWRALTSAL